MAVPVSTTIQNQIANLYIAILGRNPEPVGFGYWCETLANNNGTQAALNAITVGFGNSPEFNATYGGQTTSAAITLMYNNVLNRAPDAGGLAYWTTQYNTILATNGDVSASLALTGNAIITAAAANTGTADQTNIQAKQAAAIGSGTTAPSTTVALTTNVESVTVGSNTTVVGVVGPVLANPTQTTLQAGDTITGTGTANTLRVVDSSGGLVNAIAGVTMSGVQTLQVQMAGAVTTTYALGGTVTGVTAVQGSNGIAGSFLNFTGLTAGSTVTLSGAGTGAAAGVGFQYTIPTSAVTVNLNGGITALGTSVQAIGGTATSATLTSTGGVNGVATDGTAAPVLVAFTGAARTLTNLTVNAATNARVTLANTDFAAAGAALVVSGAATSVNLGTEGIYKTINASGLTAGGVTVNASSSLTSFIGGTGNDSLTQQGAGTAVIAATATIDAGTGVDTIASVLVNAGNAAAFKNFEVLSIGGQGLVAGTFDGSLMTGSVLTGVSIGAALGGALTVSNLIETTTGFNVSVGRTAGAATTLSFTSASVAGTADIVNLTFNNSRGAGGVDANTISMSNIEVLNIVSGGSIGSLNAVTITGTALQTVTITGSQNLTYATTAQTQYSTATSTQLTRIDGSAATGNLTITDNGAGASGGINPTKASITILGGSGSDIITVTTSARGNTAGASSTAFGADTVTTGGGIDNVIVTTAIAQSQTAPAFTTITDLVAGDSITLLGTAAAFNRTAVNVSAATSLVDALNIDLTANDGAGAVSYFTFVGNTYVANNAAIATAGLQTADVVVRLTGTVDLSNASMVANALVLA
jgi:S-layer protein